MSLPHSPRSLSLAVARAALGVWFVCSLGSLNAPVAWAQEPDAINLYESAREFREAPLPAPGSHVVVATSNIALVADVLRDCPQCRVDWRYPAAQTRAMTAKSLSVPMGQWRRLSGQADDAFWAWLKNYENPSAVASAVPEISAIVTDDLARLAQSLGRGRPVAQAQR